VTYWDVMGWSIAFIGVCVALGIGVSIVSMIWEAFKDETKR
jgi:hypothetical protein